MKTSDFHFDLPKENIAQEPLEQRDSSRLLIFDRRSGSIVHRFFNNLPDYLNEGDLMVLNDTRVIPARLLGQKLPSGGKVEIFLLRELDQYTWECLVRGKGIDKGKVIQIEEGLSALIQEVLNGAQRIVSFDKPVRSFLNRLGMIPIPPYINLDIPDKNRYQTIFSRVDGSVAAPTAGLHFTQDLINKLTTNKVRFTYLTIHIGLDTFKPVKAQFPENHKIHSEWCKVTPETALLVNQTRESGGRIIAVGTSSVRALESCAHNLSGEICLEAFEGFTNLFILPGFKFQIVDCIITNFHLPESTLIMLVSAFAGRKEILDVYKIAIEKGYRFYSFGDAMMII